MSKVSKNIITTSLLLVSVLVGVQAQAEIQTSVVQNDWKRSDAMMKFSKNTPCYIVGSKDFPETSARTVQIFKDVGFNITEDDSADCKIVLFGEVNYGKNTSEQVVYSVRALSGTQPWSDKLVSPNPSILEKANAARAQLATPNKPSVDGNGINILAQAGHAIGGAAGASVLGGVGTLINIFTSFKAAPTTPEGMASAEGQLVFGHLFKTTGVSSKIYAASDTPEKPEDLYYAGVKKVAMAMEYAISECHFKNNQPFDMPIPLGVNPKLWPRVQDKATATQAKTEQD